MSEEIAIEPKQNKYNAVFKAIQTLGIDAKAEAVRGYLMTQYGLDLPKSMLASYTCKARKELGGSVRPRKEKAPAGESNGHAGPKKKRGRPAKAKAAAEVQRRFDSFAKTVDEYATDNSIGTVPVSTENIGDVLNAFGDVHELVKKFGKEGVTAMVNCV